MLDALEGRTKVKYLGRRSTSEVLAAAWRKTKEKLASEPSEWRLKAPGIQVSGQTPIPYSDRGTYIQIVELFSKPIGRSVLPPGVAESGEHAQDQVALARAWLFKPMLLP